MPGSKCFEKGVGEMHAASEGLVAGWHRTLRRYMDSKMNESWIWSRIIRLQDASPMGG